MRAPRHARFASPSAAGWALALVVLAAQAHAGVQTLAECAEGAEFIANAARARDNGITREAFVGRLERDLVAIRAFPPALRWFVKDDADEQFLVAAAARVYDRPRSTGEHHAEFLAACIARTRS